MASLEQRLAALERQDESRAGVLVFFEPLDDEQRQEAQAAAQAGATVVRVVFG
jgi:hypothetical protein